MKKLLLTLTGCLALSAALAPKAQAITASDLDGKGYGVALYGDQAQLSCLVEQFGGKFEMRDGQLYMTNFWRGFDMPVTVSGNTITLSTNILTGGADSQYAGEEFRICGAWSGYNSSYTFFAFNRYTSTSVSLTCKQDGGNGNYYFLKDGFIGAQMTTSIGLAEGFYQGMAMHVFDANCVAHDYINGELIDTYPVSINISDPNNVVLKNWGNMGFNFTNTLQNTSVNWTKASIDFQNNTFTIPYQIIGGDVHANVSLTSDSRYDMCYYWYGNNPTIEHYYAGDMSRQAIVGTLDGRGEPFHKNVEENHWSKTHGGSLETWQKLDIILGSQQTYSTLYGTVATVDKTVYETPFDFEYTHDAQLSTTSFGLNDGAILVKGTINSRVNNKYIDSYDLYIVSGRCNSIDDADFTADHEDGLVGAVKVAEGISNLNRSTDGDIPVDVYASRPAALENNPANQYTLFLKANYNNSLHHTFHALTPQNTPTGIDDIAAAEAGIEIRVVEGGVEVAGFDGMVEVYNASGAQVFAGVADGRIELASGLYIVKAGTKAQKVNVR